VSSRSYRVIIPPELQGERLDKAVASLCDGVSRTLARKLLQAGAVRLDGKRCRTASRIVAPGERLEATVDPAGFSAERAEAPRVVGQGRGYIVIDKPPGQLSQGTAAGDEGTALRAVERLVADSAGQGAGVWTVHRLDAAASGLLVFATSKRAAADLSSQLQQHTARRGYLALIGGIPRTRAGVIDAPLRKVGSGRVVVDPEGQPAISRWLVVATYPDRELSLLRVELETGRMHQIRAHLAHALFPIVGDDRYGSARRGERLRLHAERLRFRTPAGVVDLALAPDAGFWAL
jgi:23S rRNA pseudouridine1911/1915/1917 synthase